MIYIHEDLTKSYEEILPLRLYSSFDNGQINDLYTKFLSETNIIKEIEIDNMKFLKEVEEYQIRNQIKTIFEDYHREFQYINEVERKIKEKQEKQENKKVSLTPTLNFCIFLRLHKGNKENKFDPLVNWNILNHCISMGCPELKSLENFVNFPPTWQEKFKEQIKKMNEMSKYKSVVLDIPMDQYMELLNEYNELTLLISISTYFLKKAVENNFKESLFAAIYLKKYLQGSKNQFFTKFNIEFFKILLLFICSKIHENLKEELLVEVKKNIFN